MRVFYLDSDHCASSYERWEPLLLQVTKSYKIFGINTMTDCPKCLDDGLNISCLGGKQLNEHVLNEHPTISLEWECDQCNKIFPKLHAWRCHYPKCKGKPDNPLAIYECSECHKKFETKIGLSQHERHAHPSLHNAKRAVEANVPAGKSGRKLIVWTEEELKKLQSY